jgi:hypothetical protein
VDYLVKVNMLQDWEQQIIRICVNLSDVLVIFCSGFVKRINVANEVLCTRPETRPRIFAIL